MPSGLHRFLGHLRRELRRGTLPIRVLEQLDSGPTYGYELLVRLRRDSPDGAPIGPSTLYPALARLRRAGLVRAYYGTTSRGPLRKYYEITVRGRDALPALRSALAEERWLTGPPRRLVRPAGAGR